MPYNTDKLTDIIKQLCDTHKHAKLGKNMLRMTQFSIVAKSWTSEQKILALTKLYESLSDLFVSADDYIVLLQMLAIKTSGLAYISSASGYLTFLRHNQKSISERYKQILTLFIRDSLSTFKQRDTKLDQIIELHKYIFSIQTEDREITVCALIKLKEAFINDFQGADRIRLLDPLCDNPCDMYKRQIKKLEKLYCHNCL